MILQFCFTLAILFNRTGTQRDRCKILPSIALIRMYSQVHHPRCSANVKLTIAARSPAPGLLSSLLETEGAGQNMRNPVLSIFELEIMTTVSTPMRTKHCFFDGEIKKIISLSPLC